MTDTATEVAEIEERQRLERIQHRLSAAYLELDDALADVKVSDAWATRVVKAKQDVTLSKDLVILSIQARERVSEAASE